MMENVKKKKARHVENFVLRLIKSLLRLINEIIKVKYQSLFQEWGFIPLLPPKLYGCPSQEICLEKFLLFCYDMSC